MPTTKTIESLLEHNQAWARRRVEEDPQFFKRLLGLQSPKFLWVGCSDSRVPANEITGTEPGEIFVHRNVANLVVHTDINLLSVLEYAVTQLKVEHVIVCGHYGCGGVLAAMRRNSFGVLNKWLRNIKDVYRLHEADLEACPDEPARARLLVELNVREQVLNLAKTSILQKAWKYEHRPVLHGWVYGLENGLLKPLVTMQPGHDLHPLYRYEDL
ncbi:MAG: carbonic anhydrase [Myxococcaceae bacterium]|jgi:carbonic anhydrase|nr:carbonic anhydrase [Myxococcaceae bacterium]